MNRHALAAWEMFKACAHREVILMKRHSFTYKTRSVCHPEHNSRSYAVLSPISYVYLLLSCTWQKHVASCVTRRPGSERLRFAGVN